MHRVDGVPGVTVFVIEQVVDVLTLFAFFQERCDQHVIVGLLVDPGVGVGEVHPELAKAALIVRVNDLQMGNGMRDVFVAITLTSSFQGIERDTRGAVANAVNVNAEAIGIEGAGVVLEVFRLVIDDAVFLRVFAVLGNGDNPGVGVVLEVGGLIVVQHSGIG
ncbi:hypothetical protein D3C80_721490 [compost metagenome]